MSDVEKIVKMLETGTAELQCAAAMVLGELASPAAHKALLQALKSENETLRVYSVEALGKINAKEAAPHLVPLLASGGRLRARIQQVLVAIGDEVVPLLQKHIDKAEPALRSAILEVLGQFKSVDLSDTMFDALTDKNPDVVRQGAEGLRTRFASLAGPEREKAVKQVTGFLDRKLSPASAATGIRLLAVLKDPSSVKPLLKFLGKKEDLAVRQAALEALGAVDLGKEAERVGSAVIGLLDEEPLVSSAIIALARARVGRDESDKLLKLVDSRIAAVRLFALRALGATGGARAAEGLVKGLHSSDGRIVDESQQALKSNAAFAPALLKSLTAEEDINRAWKLANILRTYREAFDKPTVKAFLAKFLKMYDKRSALFQVYFEILRSVAPSELREAIVDRGRELMKKRKFDDAERILRLVSRDDLATGESDFVLAEALLVTLRKEIATARLDRSQAVGLFSKLIRRGEFPVMKELERDAAKLGSDSLLYLGFVLAERQGVERDLGAAVLKLVVKKFGRSKDGETARQKLKTQGV